MIPGVRKAVLSASPYVPGKTVEEVRRELSLERIVKLGSNENPWGPFPAARAAMAEEIVRLNTYPDVSFRELKGLIARQSGLEPEWVALSHGAEGMLQTLGRFFLEPATRVVPPEGNDEALPENIPRHHGASLREIPLGDDFSMDLRK
jgi:histidinol-phosphate aminotransferase